MYHIQLVKAYHKASLDSTGGETESFLDEGSDNHIQIIVCGCICRYQPHYLSSIFKFFLLNSRTLIFLGYLPFSFWSRASGEAGSISNLGKVDPDSSKQHKVVSFLMQTNDKILTSEIWKKECWKVSGKGFVTLKERFKENLVFSVSGYCSVYLILTPVASFLQPWG